jgi:VWFA-related protein
LILVLSILLSMSAFQPLPQGDGPGVRITQVDTSQFPEVTVYVAVSDSQGQPLGVDPDRIQLLENGQVIPPESITGAGEVPPLNVLLAVDISGSMLYLDKLKAARQAAVLFVEQLRPADRVGLLTFHTETDYVQPLTTDRDLILSAIQSLEAKDDTAMYDALVEAAGIMEGVSGRAAIVAITDGLDTLSESSPETVLQQIGPAGLSISTIGLGDPDQDLAEKTALDVEALTYLAENSGGVYSFAEDTGSLDEIYQAYAASFKSEYQLTYTSPSSLRDGVNRSLSARLADAPAGTEDEEMEAVTYNPGGLVPEVTGAVPAPVFGGLLLVFVGLLFLPNVIVRFRRPEKPEPPQPKIKLKE